MGDQPQRDVKKAELSLLKLVFPRIYGEHEECCICAISKGAYESTYSLSQLTKVGEDYYCSEHVPQCRVLACHRIDNLHIGPLDDFFLRSLPYTLVDASEMSIHL
jgi:hypothetical protein